MKDVGAMFAERHHYWGLFGTKVRKLVDLLLDCYSIRRDRRFQTTDPKDKIYGLLGLASDVEQLDILPDYTKSVEEIYTEVASKILSDGDFRLLQACQHKDGRVLKLPSWVPDWRLDLLSSPSDFVSIGIKFRASGTHRCPERPRRHPFNPRILQ